MGLSTGLKLAWLRPRVCPKWNRFESGPPRQEYSHSASVGNR